MSLEIRPDQVRSVKIQPNGGLKVGVIDASEKDAIETNKVIGIKNNRSPHSQLHECFRFLLAHAALIGDLSPKGHVIDGKYLKGRKIIDDSTLIAYRVLGFTLKGDMNGDSIQIEVEKRLSKGGTFEFKLPLVKLYSGSQYEFSGNLVEDLQMAISEVVEYVNDDKYMESTQYTMDFAGKENDDPQF